MTIVHIVHRTNIILPKDPVNWGLYINVISKSILHLSSIS